MRMRDETAAMCTKMIKKSAQETSEESESRMLCEVQFGARKEVFFLIYFFWREPQMKCHKTQNHARTTSEVDGATSSQPGAHLRSNKEKARALAAVHANNEDHLVIHALFTKSLNSSGSSLASATRWRKRNDSADHLPPTSHAKTTNRARPCTCANSG